jgi:recombinational DNA repair protein (RecF pathway)
MAAHDPTTTPALWVSSKQVGESDALVRFFTPHEGALTTKARGLLKPGSKLAPVLKPADELSIAVAGVRGIGTLAGALCTREHAFWRADLSRLALVWFMTEALYVGSGTPQLNASSFQLTANLLRTVPAVEAIYGAGAVFATRMLMLHGLMADLELCIVDHNPLPAGAPCFLLPSGEGLVGLAAYNRQYARGRAGLIRMSPDRLARWRNLQHCPLLEYPAARADRIDAALLCTLLARHLSHLANQPLETMRFLKKQWRLPGISEAVRELENG